MRNLAMNVGQLLGKIVGEHSAPGVHKLSIVSDNESYEYWFGKNISGEALLTQGYQDFALVIVNQLLKGGTTLTLRSFPEENVHLWAKGTAVDATKLQEVRAWFLIENNFEPISAQALKEAYSGLQLTETSIGNVNYLTGW